MATLVPGFAKSLTPGYGRLRGNDGSLMLAFILRRVALIIPTLIGVSLPGYSMPIFWWALLLILFFSVQLGWTPVSGRIAVEYDVPAASGFMLIDTLRAGDWSAFRSALSHLVLPSIALGTIPLAVIARMTRSAMLEVLREDYVRTARA